MHWVRVPRLGKLCSTECQWTQCSARQRRDEKRRRTGGPYRFGTAAAARANPGRRHCPDARRRRPRRRDALCLARRVEGGYAALVLFYLCGCAAPCGRDHRAVAPHLGSRVVSGDGGAGPRVGIAGDAAARSIRWIVIAGKRVGGHSLYIPCCRPCRSPRPLGRQSPFVTTAGACADPSEWLES
jgi:hypothetical protein